MPIFPFTVAVRYMDVELNYDWLYIFSGPVINQSRALVDTGLQPRMFLKKIINCTRA